MTTLIILCAIGFIIYKISKKKKDFSSKPKTSIQMSVHYSGPSPEEWEKIKTERKKAKEDSIDSLRNNYKAPGTREEAFNNLFLALMSYRKSFGVEAKVEELDGLYSSAEDLKKKELILRKSINENYKLRYEKNNFHTALYLAALHAKLLCENPSSDWKNFIGLKKLFSALNNDFYRTHCLGIYFHTLEANQNQNTALVKLCQDDINRIFTAWHSDNNREMAYTANVSQLENKSNASDKHFVLNPIVEYLNRRIDFDPAARNLLISYCEQDMALYKKFLAQFASLGSKKLTFEQALKSKYYMVPHLPSFNCLWELYESEENMAKLLELKKIASEIRYGLDCTMADDNSSNDEGTNTEVVSNLPTEVIEATKSGKTGKKSFLSSSGELCSIEDAAKEHFERLGFSVLRGEVQFWQAMFGIFFWDEIFKDSQGPNSLNDIPEDLFVGEEFYESRKSAIDAKSDSILNGNLVKIYEAQLKKSKTSWTRIIHGNGRDDFSYSNTLESKAVTEFLKTINPKTFSLIVTRIAHNPTENRAGLPDYVMWKDTDILFMEVKGINERIRDSQEAWIKWMMSKSIPVQVVRVKGAPKDNAA